MLFIIAPLLLMIVLIIIEERDCDTTFSSAEYRKTIKRNNRKAREDMNLKKLFCPSGKKAYDSYTIEDVMEYLRQEGLRPEIDQDDARVIGFKYQRKTIRLAVIDNFFRISSLWNAKQNEANIEAIYTTSMKVMDQYRYIRIIYVSDVLEFAMDQTITSLDHFKEVFNLSLDLINESVEVYFQEYYRLIEYDADTNVSRRNNIYLPEFRWLPDVVFTAVTKGNLAPEALVDEDWIRKEIQNRITDTSILKEWNSFKINSVDNYGDYKLIIYQFPTPKVVPEAKYGAVLMNTKTIEINYYTLEMTLNNKWVYGSMSSECHNNYGEVDSADLDKFIEWIFTKDKQVVACHNYTTKQELIA